MRLIDSHIHLDKYKGDDFTQILESSCIIDSLISVSVDLESCKRNLELARIYPKVEAAFGYHPEQKLPADEEKNELFSWMGRYKDEMIAIGEVGLPQYLTREQKITISQYQQYVELLKAFVEKASQWVKPIILHAVYEDAPVACDLLEKFSIQRAHFHWFKGDKKTVDRMKENGYYISITPEVVYKDKIQQLVQTYPLELMMIETDGPWPFEGPFLGKFTHPIMMLESIQKIAKIKKLSSEEVADRLYQNTLSFYKLQAI